MPSKNSKLMRIGDELAVVIKEVKVDISKNTGRPLETISDIETSRFLAERIKKQKRDGTFNIFR